MVRFPEILQLQYIDKVVDFYCAGYAVLECRRGGDSRAPTVAARRILDSCCMPVVCNDRSVLSMTWRSSSTVVDVAVLPQRQVPAVGLDSWDEG